MYQNADENISIKLAPLPCYATVVLSVHVGAGKKIHWICPDHGFNEFDNLYLFFERALQSRTLPIDSGVTHVHGIALIV